MYGPNSRELIHNSTNKKSTQYTDPKRITPLTRKERQARIDNNIPRANLHFQEIQLIDNVFKELDEIETIYKYLEEISPNIKDDTLEEYVEQLYSLNEHINLLQAQYINLGNSLTPNHNNQALIDVIKYVSSIANYIVLLQQDIESIYTRFDARLKSNYRAIKLKEKHKEELEELKKDFKKDFYDIPKDDSLIYLRKKIILDVYKFEKNSLEEIQKAEKESKSETEIKELKEGKIRPREILSFKVRKELEDLKELKQANSNKKELEAEGARLFGEKQTIEREAQRENQRREVRELKQARELAEELKQTIEREENQRREAQLKQAQLKQAIELKQIRELKQAIELKQAREREENQRREAEKQAQLKQAIEKQAIEKQALRNQEREAELKQAI